MEVGVESPDVIPPLRAHSLRSQPASEPEPQAVAAGHEVQASPARDVQTPVMGTESSRTTPRPQPVSRVGIQPRQTFIEAFPLWLDSRAKIDERTRQDYIRYGRSIARVFGDVPLRDIHAEMLREYQKNRAAGDRRYFKEPAGPVVINKEIGTLLQVRRRANIEDNLEDIYEPLALPLWRPPRSISEEQEEAFLRALRSRDDWRVAYLCAVVGLKTGVVGAELRNARIEQFDTDTRHLHVSGRVKNQFRVRKVPLVSAAFLALQELVQIATAKGASKPEHYLLPFRLAKGHWDPNRPCTYSLIKKAWADARKLADLPSTFTPHSPRHQVNTKLYEAGTDDMTVQAIMGHQGRKMSEYYSHIRDKRKREAMEAAMGNALQALDGSPQP